MASPDWRWGSLSRGHCSAAGPCFSGVLTDNVSSKSWNLKWGDGWVKKRWVQIDLSYALSDGAVLLCAVLGKRRNKKKKKQPKRQELGFLNGKKKSGSIRASTAWGCSPTWAAAAHLVVICSTICITLGHSGYLSKHSLPFSPIFSSLQPTLSTTQRTWRLLPHTPPHPQSQIQGIQEIEEHCSWYTGTPH